MYKTSLIILIIGSVLFLIAAFWPTSRVFVEPLAEKKLEIIMSDKTGWDLMQVLFGAGAFLAAVGIALLAYHLQMLAHSRVLQIAAFLLIAGSMLWIWHLYIRIVDPVSFAHRLQPWWHFAGYTILTQVGLGLMGYFFLKSIFPNWVGWMLIAGMPTLFLLTLIFQDMPPFVYYIFLIITSIVLLRNAPFFQQTAVIS